MSAITALDVIYGKDLQPPPGYKKIEKDLNKGARGEYVYLCYSTSAPGDPITDIQVFAGGDANFAIQNGYESVRKDLNKGARGKYIYVCFTRSSSLGLPPVTGVDVIQGPNRYTFPGEGWVRINQDCSEGANGDYTYVCITRK